ncbi:MAG: neutral zinc metallopeptidase [Verrucomicrobiota bacterium]
MRWKGRKASTNVEDRRAQSGPSRSVGRGGAGLGILAMIGRRFGIKGIVIAAALFLIMWRLGVVDPAMFMEGGATSAPSQQVEISAEEQELYEFVTVVLAGTEEVWGEQFAEAGRRYQPPTLVVYRNSVRTACGLGRATSGPFYCPGDYKIYIDLSFYNELARTFQAPGDFAQAYVIAHEVGHHVQKLIGTLDKVSALRGRPEYNEYSVRLELQADYYAGVWAHHSRQYLEHGDIEEAMRAANAVGDDAIQMRSQGRIVPHAFTHGTSEQRMRWFSKGLRSGDISGGDTFSQPYNAL